MFLYCGNLHIADGSPRNLEEERRDQTGSYTVAI